MIVEKDAAIPVGDGTALGAIIFRPEGEGRFPVLMSMGIYGKDIHFEDGYPSQWASLLSLTSLVGHGSSGRYLRWEQIDPERWVPDGYVVIAIDARGSGRSPGYLDPFSPRETQDYFDAIEWAAGQPWSNGKVGLIGISYLAIKQWQVAALKPPHLAAICPWEGGSDLYRDWSHHGGIFSNVFPTAWWPRQVLPNQNGNGATHHRDRETGEPTTGPVLPEHLLRANRADHVRELFDHPFDDAWYRERTPDPSRIEVPLYSAGNWGGAGLHLRGNVEGFVRAASREKWLDLHVGTHFESFYKPEYVARQKRFFDCFLKGEENGWRDEPPIRMEVRGPDGATERYEHEWPLTRTRWTRYHLDPEQLSLTEEAPEGGGGVSYDALGDGVTFRSAPLPEEMEFTGPLMVRLWAASSTVDLDVFATLRMFGPDGSEITFVGASDVAPVARGWLRASHRKLDRERSSRSRPWHVHDGRQDLTPGEAYPLDVEIWPTSAVYPPGYRIALTISGRDFEAGDVPGRILHNHEEDRSPSRFGGRNTILSGPGRRSFLLLPLIRSQAPR